MHILNKQIVYLNWKIISRNLNCLAKYGIESGAKMDIDILQFVFESSGFNRFLASFSNLLKFCCILSILAIALIQFSVRSNVSWVFLFPLPFVILPSPNHPRTFHRLSFEWRLICFILLPVHSPGPLPFSSKRSSFWLCVTKRAMTQRVQMRLHATFSSAPAKANSYLSRSQFSAIFSVLALVQA